MASSKAILAPPELLVVAAAFVPAQADAPDSVDGAAFDEGACCLLCGVCIRALGGRLSALVLLILVVLLRGTLASGLRLCLLCLRDSIPREVVKFSQFGVCFGAGDRCGDNDVFARWGPDFVVEVAGLAA